MFLSLECLKLHKYWMILSLGLKAGKLCCPVIKKWVGQNCTGVFLFIQLANDLFPLVLCRWWVLVPSFKFKLWFWLNFGQQVVWSNVSSLKHFLFGYLPVLLDMNPSGDFCELTWIKVIHFCLFMVYSFFNHLSSCYLSTSYLHGFSILLPFLLLVPVLTRLASPLIFL